MLSTADLGAGLPLWRLAGGQMVQHSGSSQPTGQVMDDGGTVQLEGGICAGVRADLKARGHRLTAGANGGGYQSITLEHGVYVGASEMRKDGMAAGY